MLNAIHKVFVINLAHRTDRKELMMIRLLKMGFKEEQIQFVNATNRSTYSWALALHELGLVESKDNVDFTRFITKKYINRLKSKRISKEKLEDTKAQIGNFLSHVRVWSMVGKMKEYKHFLVLEDDIIPTKHWNTKTSNNLFLKSNYLPFMFVGDCWRRPDCQPIMSLPTIKCDDNFLEASYTQCLHAYIITTTFGYTIRGAFHNLFPLQPASDDWLPKFLIEYRIPFYIYNNPLIDQDDNLGTDIQFEEQPDKLVH